MRLVNSLTKPNVQQVLCSDMQTSNTSFHMKIFIPTYLQMLGNIKTIRLKSCNALVQANTSANNDS